MKRGVGLPQRILRGQRRVLPGIAALGVAAMVLSTVGSGQVGAIGAPMVDFDGDGHGDIVLGVAGEDVRGATDAGIVTVVMGDGTGINPSDSKTVGPGVDGVVGQPRAGDQFGRAFAVGDIDNDGYSDLVVGAPNKQAAGVQSAGTITVIHGSRWGLTGAGSRSFSQADVSGEPVETGDRFGSAIAVGDFNGDGYDDVAVGAPGEDVGSAVDAGTVVVFRGTANGLTASGATTFDQSDGGAGWAERDDRFGAALAAGDFDGDGRSDLAVGAPREDIGSAIDAGAVTVLRGSPGGIAANGARVWSQADRIRNTPQSNDRFGFALSTGDYDGDGRADLAIGVPGEDLRGRQDAGMVNVLYGSPSGIKRGGNQAWSQKGKVNGVLNPNDRFGSALASGDFDGNGRDDLAVGVPGENLKGRADVGQVNVIYGTRDGLRVAGDWKFSQAGEISDSIEAHDQLGSSVQAVDLNGDGHADLVAGAPGEDLAGATDAGLANIVYGSGKGLRVTRNESVAQAGAVAGTAESGDGLGLPRYESWLDRVNFYRTQAGLDPVAERASLSAAAAEHSRYMVLNSTVTHSQTRGNPGYSSAGDASGGRSNVYGTSLVTTTDLTAIDGWVTGPFHAVGFLTPHLVEVGYAAYRDAGAERIRMAATLDIWGAQRDWGKTADGPYTWPGDGSVVPVRNHINEWPSPTTHCPGHNGLPVMAFFEDDVNVQSATFTRNGRSLAFCVFDGTDYKNPDAGARNLGRAILDGANAVVVMPRNALLPGEEYCFSVRSSGVRNAACFTVDPNA